MSVQPCRHVGNRFSKHLYFGGGHRVVGPLGKMQAKMTCAGFHGQGDFQLHLPEILFVPSRDSTDFNYIDPPKKINRKPYDLNYALRRGPEEG